MCIGNKVVNCCSLPVTEKFPSHESFSGKNWESQQQTGTVDHLN